MSKPQEHIDAYAETHVLVQPQAVRVVSADSDSLALYDEYARELAGSQTPRSAAKVKRAAPKRRKV